ncbi:hypothetical protein Tsubulata_046735 [Turnera subulata]|uniref:Lipoxygenase domain-containing protein n=1 Tax=Turnera subulata TaxID=218843 RepID=A0A9Q0JAD4_9ROSI|nr:hypothetical protein Tsubulata_046735 [Turnera subulata]
MGPVRLLLLNSKALKKNSSTKLGGISPERLLCDKSKVSKTLIFPRVVGIPPDIKDTYGVNFGQYAYGGYFPNHPSIVRALCVQRILQKWSSRNA